MLSIDAYTWYIINVSYIFQIVCIKCVLTNLFSWRLQPVRAYDLNNVFDNTRCFSFSSFFYINVVSFKFYSEFLHFQDSNRRYQYLVWGHEEAFFVKEHSDFKCKYTENDIIKDARLFGRQPFLCLFRERFFRQIVGIPIGTNCAPLLMDIFLYSYEAELISLCS